MHAYKCIGRIPAGLSAAGDPAKRALLNQLPRLLAGYGKTPGIDAVVVVVDSDSRDCTVFLAELMALLARCEQATVCGTWELLADAVHPGGSRAVKKAGRPLPGDLKHEWAWKIGPHMDIASNLSPSFCKFRDGLRRLVA